MMSLSDFLFLIKEPRNYLRLLAVPYFLIIIYAMIISPHSFGFDYKSYFGLFIIVFFFTLIYVSIMIFIKHYSFFDTHLKIIRNIIILLSVTYFFSDITIAISIISEKLLKHVWYLILISYLAILFGCFLDILNSTGLIKEHINKINQEIEYNNFNVRINNEHILNDSVFALPSKLINQTLDMVEEYINNINKMFNEIKIVSDQLFTSSKDISQTAETVTSTSENVSITSNNQAQLISEVVDKVYKLYDDVNNIVSLIQNDVKVVSNIALQTNILALNAGIEASRAGDYGRGFAVVAENIRKLSNETKSAVNKISENSTFIADVLNNGIKNIQIPINEIASMSEETAASAEEQAASSEEMLSIIQVMSETISTLIDVNDSIVKFRNKKSKIDET